MRRAAVAVFVLSGTAACASTGATFGSGVGDAFLGGAPYYAGTSIDRVREEGGRLGHLPVAYQRGASQASFFDPEAGSAMQTLLDRMTGRLDSTEVSVRLVEGGRVSAVAHEATRVPPDVHFGCTVEMDGFEEECGLDSDIALGRGDQRMRLAVGRPSTEWIAWIADVMAAQGVDRTLVVTVEVGHYPLLQRGLLGRKEVELGTGHVVPVPWLTSLETPVPVLQLTGALVRPDGTAVRIGAEGMIARRTRMAVSAIGGQELITNEEVEALLTLRRDDLPGAPLVWEVALQNLLDQLLGVPSAHAAHHP